MHGRRCVEGAMNDLVGRLNGQWVVIDVLQGTTLEEYGKKEGCGLWLMQQVVPGDAVQEWAAGCEKMFSQFETVTKVGKRAAAYQSIQAVDQGCLCVDRYAGTARHRRVKLPDNNCGVLSRCLDWVHGVLGTRVFNQAIANRYKVWCQNIPWHTDANLLLDVHPTIMSISLGPTPGVLCYAPRVGAGFAEQWRNATGARGIVVLKPGDVLVMSGAFQQCFVHMTLKHEDIWKQPDAVLAEYAAVNEFIKPSLYEFLRQVAGQEPAVQTVGVRHVISLREIVHHQSGCPAACSCRALGPSAIWKRYFYIHRKYHWTKRGTGEKFFEETGSEEMPGSRRPRPPVKPRIWERYRGDVEGNWCWWYNSITEEFFLEDETIPVVNSKDGVWTRSWVSHVEHWWWNPETDGHYFE